MAFCAKQRFLGRRVESALIKFCTSLDILPRKMGIDFYTYKLVLQNIICHRFVTTTLS